MKYLDEKKKQETTTTTTGALGCGICFGLLEKFSQTEYLEQVANDIRASGIQFNDFRISLTAPNLSTLREVNRITKNFLIIISGVDPFSSACSFESGQRIAES
jgi:hypothetical protein